MTLEDFKEVYKDKTPVEKLRLMQVQHNYWRNDVKDRVDANWRGNYEEARYYASECDAMADRVAWLHDEISKALEKLEPVKPVKDESLFRCGNCKSAVVGYVADVTKFRIQTENYCHNCGKAVKWE